MVGMNRQRVQDARMARGLHRNFTKRRQKIILDRPRSFREKEMAKLVRLKKEQISDFKRTIPRELARVPSDGSGVNYRYSFVTNGKPKEITFDFKFSYGEAGLRSVGLRVKNRRLDNAAEWAMVMDRRGYIEIFRMEHIRNFVRTKWGSVSQKSRIRKNGYDVFPVSLDAILKAEGVKPIVCQLESASIRDALKQVKEAEFGPEAAQAPTTPDTKIRKRLADGKPPFALQKARARPPRKQLMPSQGNLDKRRIIRAYEKGHR